MDADGKAWFSRLGDHPGTECGCAGFIDAASTRKVSSSISLLPSPPQTFAHTIPCSLKPLRLGLRLRTAGPSTMSC